ncbi:Peptidyl-prolyl cis-trans isomerase Mip [Porphyridium purpureum]|uniref:peptidylprolyl isomerase n=1 Tax=Porphyridium purpureum TaxID=35688 RepID=A0A5J4YU46_PORPP|nr:Peptidyl-prolyl cis-trans isomerase Mip [Porphyridium purpureum]|eukprot:POR9823..scf227_4
MIVTRFELARFPTAAFRWIGTMEREFKIYISISIVNVGERCDDVRGRAQAGCGSESRNGSEFSRTGEIWKDGLRRGRRGQEIDGGRDERARCGGVGWERDEGRGERVRASAGRCRMAPFFVKVKCFNGKSYELRVSGGDTVENFMGQIASLSGIGAERQMLLFKGQKLEPAQTLEKYGVADGSTINVMRRMGANATAAAKDAAPAAATTAAGGAVTATAGATATADSDVADMMAQLNAMGLGGGAEQGAPDLNALMQQMMGGAGAAGAAGANPAAAGGGMDLNAMMQMLGGLGGGNQADGGAGGAGGAADIMAQLPNMMSGLWNSEAMQEYLNDPEKQEASREAIRQNPMLSQWLQSDPEFAKVVNDPSKWHESMEAAKAMFEQSGANVSSAGARRAGGASTRAASGLGTKRKTAADVAPAGTDMGKIAEAYGHALGQSLLSSGLGLDVGLVVKGLKSAAAGEDFPMSYPEYEKQMVGLHQIAAELVAEQDLADADEFFKTKSSSLTVLEPGKVLAESFPSDELDENAPVVLETATVLLILQGRLLDKRVFFTCPAAENDSNMVQVLTLPLDSAPAALKTGIVGMREGEEKILYVHPSACEGMTDMFGEMLPPNALLIFEVEIVSANAPEEPVDA